MSALGINLTGRSSSSPAEPGSSTHAFRMHQDDSSCNSELRRHCIIQTHDHDVKELKIVDVVRDVAC